MTTPAFAFGYCPSNYQQVNSYDRESIRVALYSGGDSISVQNAQWKDCAKQEYGSKFDFICGNLKLRTTNIDSYIGVQPSDPSLSPITFQRVGTGFWFRYGLPKNMEYVKKEWCELNGSEGKCYYHGTTTWLYIPYYTYNGAIKAKLLAQFIKKTIRECKIIKIDF